MSDPLDPFSDLAEAAAAQHEMYLTWVGAGCTSDQAMDLLKTTMVEILRRDSE